MPEAGLTGDIVLQPTAGRRRARVTEGSAPATLVSILMGQDGDSARRAGALACV